MDNTQQQEIYTRLNSLLSQIIFDIQPLFQHTNEDWDRWHELRKMGQNCSSMYNELDKTSVECRRLGRETIAFRETYQKLNKSLDLLEQFIMTAILLRD